MTDVAALQPPPLQGAVTDIGALQPPPLPGIVRFLGKEQSYWQLRVRGAALLLVTLGIYRFWLNRGGFTNHHQTDQQWRGF
ncbi:MAG: hypothetical protein ACLQFW_16595 [Xanthobacteraceae bacterium]